jgi:hypothetical protein
MFKRVLFCVMLCALGGAATAEIWGFIDDKGVGHFSSTKLDERYELFSKGDGPQAISDKPSEANNWGQTLIVERSENEGLSPIGLPPKLAKFFESSQTLKAVRPHMQTAAQKHSIDVELLQALIAAESGFNLTAISPKGALGLMQLMPATAARYGVHADKKPNGSLTQQQKLFDAQTNIAAGSRYLRDLLNMFKGRTDLALAAYNAGEGAVQKAGNKIPNYPETQNYVRTVMQIHAALKPPPPPAPPSQPLPIKALEPKRPAGTDPLRPTKGRGNGLPIS